MKNYIWFGLGLLTGTAGGVLGSMKYFKKKYSEEAEQRISEMEDYSHWTKAYARTSEDEDTEEVDHEERQKMMKEQRDMEPVKKVDYVSMYPNLNKETEEEEETPEKKTHEEHQKNKNRPPRIISAEESGNLDPHYEYETLVFYAYDEVLVDENDCVIEDPRHLVGDSLEKYDFINSDEEIIFVLNYELTTCYEINKVQAAFGEFNIEVE